MEKNSYWNDCLRNGAFLGVVLALSTILEYRMQLSGSMATYTLVLFEWLAVAGAHYYLLHRATHQRSMLHSADEGFTFGQGYSYVLSMSAVAGLCVGFVQVVYLHLFMGYTVYMERLVDSLTSVLSQGSNIPASMEPLIAQSLEQLRTAAEPSFLATIWGGVFSALLFGAIFGLIIAGVLSRAPRPFDTSEAADSNDSNE